MEVQTALLPLATGLKRLFTSAEHADLTIICKERQWKVHKVILCAQSEWFQKSCSGPFKEAKSSDIKLEDDDPQVVDALLHYLYSFDYGDYSDNQKDVAPILLDVRVFAAADKYFLAPLKKLAVDKYTERAEAEWGTDGFASAAAEIYGIVPAHEDALRHTAIRVVKKHAAKLFDEQTDHCSCRKVVREVAAFGADVSQALALAAKSAPPAKTVFVTQSVGTWYLCPRCSSRFAIATGSMSVFGCPKGCHGFQASVWERYIVDP